jgi:capsular exopolysaccharide synthesis family protein
MDANYKEQALEAFNTVRTNLGFLSVDKQVKTIMVTSSIKGEGKSTISANLANTISTAHTKVLLVDADLRNPTVHRMFGVPNRTGLSDLIMAGGSEDRSYDCIIKHKRNLDLLTAGHRPPNPTELLSSRRMSRILEELSEYYDYILIETPPILVVPDAMALYHNVDGFILVSRTGIPPRSAGEHEIGAGGCQCKAMACIFNAIPDMHKAYSYYGYYDYTDIYKKGRRKKKRKKGRTSTVVEKKRADAEMPVNMDFSGMEKNDFVDTGDKAPADADGKVSSVTSSGRRKLNGLGD